MEEKKRGGEGSERKEDKRGRGRGRGKKLGEREGGDGEWHQLFRGSHLREKGLVNFVGVVLVVLVVLGVLGCYGFDDGDALGVLGGWGVGSRRRGGGGGDQKGEGNEKRKMF